MRESHSIVSSSRDRGHPLDANCGGSQSTEVDAEVEPVVWVVAEAASAFPSFGRIVRESRSLSRGATRSAVFSVILDRPPKKERGRRDDKVRACCNASATIDRLKSTLRYVSAIIIARNEGFKGLLLLLAGG